MRQDRVHCARLRLCGSGLLMRQGELNAYILWTMDGVELINDLVAVSEMLSDNVNQSSTCGEIWKCSSDCVFKGG